MTSTPSTAAGRSSSSSFSVSHTFSPLPSNLMNETQLKNFHCSSPFVKTTVPLPLWRTSPSPVWLLPFFLSFRLAGDSLHDVLIELVNVLHPPGQVRFKKKKKKKSSLHTCAVFRPHTLHFTVWAVFFCGIFNPNIRSLLQYSTCEKNLRSRYVNK